MSKLSHILSAAAILSLAFSSMAEAAEGPTSNVSSTPRLSRQAAKSRAFLPAYSETTDVDVWLTFESSPRTTSQRVRVHYANRGNQYSYSREYVLVFTSDTHTHLIFENETGSLAPDAWGSKSFVIPKQFVGNGSVVEVGLLGSDDNPNNDYDIIVLPSTPGI